MHSSIRKNVLQHKINTKTKARFSRLLPHLALKRIGPILISALHKFVTYLLTLRHLPTYLQHWDLHGTNITTDEKLG